MPDLPAPTARRLAPARWLDARLLTGVLLVLGSVGLGATVVARADDRVQVWSVTRDLGAGSTLTGDDLRVAAVRLSAAAAPRYLAAEQRAAGLVLRRPVGRGELLPVGALARAAAAGQRRVVIAVDRTGAAGLAKGRVVDLYAVRDDVGGEQSPPRLVLSAVTVAEDVRSGSGGFGGGGGTVGVTLLVDAADVPEVIDAVAHGTVHVVQVPS